MTSLKNEYANEIMEEMAKSLGDEELLKQASLEKEAQCPQCAKDKCECDKCDKCDKVKCECKTASEECDDCKEIVATQFALKHFAKVADALDGKGFNKLADSIDKFMQKLVVE